MSEKRSERGDGVGPGPGGAEGTGAANGIPTRAGTDARTPRARWRQALGGLAAVVALGLLFSASAGAFGRHGHGFPERRLARMLSEYLGEHGFELVHRVDAQSGLALALRDPFDALILDVMLPDGDGLSLCREIRARSQVPIVMLTARGEPMDRILGLELGADDYLPKPFDPRELLARLRAVLRRPERAGSQLRSPLRFGRLEIDPERRQVRLGAREVALTAHQFDLLLALAERAGRPVSRDRLMELVRGDTPGPFDRSIDVHVSRIRAAIEGDPRHPRRLLTIRGVGYVLTRDPEESD